MADKRTESEAPGGGRRKRATPTIDLKATEVTPADAPAETPPAPESQAAPQPEPQTDPAPAEAAAPASEPPPPEQPAPAADEAPPAEPQAATAPPPRRSGSGTFFVALTGGIAGAVIMSGVAAALWYGGFLPPSPSALNDQATRFAALEQQVKALRDQPPPAPDSKAIDALRARVDRLAGEIAKLPPGDKSVAERLATADNALKSLGIALAALNHRSDTIAADAQQARARADAAEKAVNELHASLQDIAKNASGGVPAAALDALQKRVDALDTLRKRVDALAPLRTRVAALEQSVKAAHETLAQNTATDRTARLAVSAAALRDAVMTGAPYAAELQAAKALGGDEKALAPLARFASSGVPGKAALARELSALMPALLQAAGTQKATGSFLDRLQTNASKLVRIEPVAAPQGDTPSEVLARIEVNAAKADIDGALTDLAKLPDAARAPAQGWIAKAKARQQALTAAQQFAAAAARALGKPASADALKKP